MQFGDVILSALDRLGPLPFTLEDVARTVLPKVPPGRVLADHEKETLALMAEVLLDECPVKVAPAVAVEQFERFLIQGHSKRAWRCRMLLFLVEYASIAAYGKPVHWLSLEERRRYVDEKLTKGGFPWSTCAKIRYLAYAGAYGDASANAATGFVPFAERSRARVSSPVIERSV